MFANNKKGNEKNHQHIVPKPNIISALPPVNSNL